MFSINNYISSQFKSACTTLALSEKYTDGWFITINTTSGHCSERSPPTAVLQQQQQQQQQQSL
jgi:hypothetical protein